MRVEIIWKDLLLSSLVVFVLFSAFSIVFPVKVVYQCPEGIESKQNSLNECLVSSLPPFPFYYLVLEMGSVIFGSYFYMQGKQLSIGIAIIVVVAMVLSMFISYVLFGLIS